MYHILYFIFLENILLILYISDKSYDINSNLTFLELQIISTFMATEKLCQK